MKPPSSVVMTPSATLSRTMWMSSTLFCSASSTRLRSITCPICRPMSATAGRRPSSGERESRLERATTPVTSRPLRMGNALAVARPAAVGAMEARKTRSPAGSVPQAGSPDAQTYPGSPIPGRKVVPRYGSSANGSSAGGGQASRGRIVFRLTSTIQISPRAQDPAWDLIRRLRGESAAPVGTHPSRRP